MNLIPRGVCFCCCHCLILCEFKSYVLGHVASCCIMLHHVASCCMLYNSIIWCDMGCHMLPCMVLPARPWCWSTAPMPSTVKPRYRAGMPWKLCNANDLRGVSWCIPQQLTLQTEILWCEVSACWHAQKLLGGVEHVLYVSSKPGMMLGKAWAGVPFCLSLTSSNWFC